jgi:FKBP-type peptidyl-prolyl cis-trans isomerase SlyD
MQAIHGTVVSFNYTLTDDDGAVLDSNERCDPLSYLHGYNNIIPGLERALEGAAAGERTQVVVEAVDAYGEVDPGAIFELPKDQFPEEVPVAPGAWFIGETADGEVPMTVLQVSDDQVLVDANHPLAGKRLHFDVEIVDVRPASDQEKRLGRPEDSGD